MSKESLGWAAGRVLKLACALMALLAFPASLAAVDPPAAACAPCHRAQTRAFADSKMTHALERAAISAILQANPKLSARIGGYSYEIVREGEEPMLSVTGGKETARF